MSTTIFREPSAQRAHATALSDSSDKSRWQKKGATIADRATEAEEILYLGCCSPRLHNSV